MRTIVIGCEQCNGVGWLETSDPERQEKCRRCHGTGIDPSYERLVEIWRRDTYSDGREWRMLTGEYLERRRSGYQIPPREEDFRHVRRMADGSGDCDCEYFHWCPAEKLPCKHFLAVPFVRMHRQSEGVYVIPYVEENQTGYLTVYVRPHDHLPALQYVVKDSRRPHWRARGCVPSWLWHGQYEIRTRGKRVHSGWVPQFPMAGDDLEGDPFGKMSAAAGT